MVVVGAGPAGLRAAGLLQEAGRSVVVLEARERVGGRLHSRTFGESRLDLGATWFWANEPNVVELANHGKVEVFAQHLAGDAMFQSDDGVQRMNGNQVDAPSGRVVDGTQTFAEVLAAQLAEGTVRLEDPVSAIKQFDEGLEVASASDTWRADHVVLAVPPATAVELIDFGQQLPDVIAGLARATPVWMGGYCKVVAHYERPFWRDSGLAGSAFSYTGPMREIHDMSGPDGQPAAMFGFVQPQPGEPAPTVGEVTEQFVALFGPEAAAPLEVVVHDWRAERYTSPPGADQLTLYQTYGDPRYQQPTLGGRLHWASTETATDVPGHIEGALSAAARAVRRILSEEQACLKYPHRRK